MGNEKIFVVVPVYKVEAYLERCVESILNQTYTNWELVLVDDGSPDNCPAICERYAAEYEKIIVIHQKNAGVSAARNTGIDYAFRCGNPEQDWINFIDSDDFVHPYYLEYLYRAAKESGTEVSCCGYLRTEEITISSTSISQLTYECITPEMYLCKNPPNANTSWAKLFRLSVFINIRYPVGKVFEDDATTHKLLFQFPHIAVIWTPLYYWYLNYSSISASEWNPSRIQKLDALEGQLTFFSERNFPAAYKSAVKTLFLSSVLQLRDVRAQSPRYDAFLKQLRQRQVRTFTLYAKNYGYGNALRTVFDIRIRRPAKHKLKRIFSQFHRR